jgi:hypothetical protein
MLLIPFSCHPYVSHQDNRYPTVWTEETTAGWVVTLPLKMAIKFAWDLGMNVCLCHNHPLVKTVEEQLMFSTLREIPVELKQFANTLHEAGCMESSQIYHALVAKCQRDDIPLTFTQMDITNKYRTTHDKSILDFTNLAEHLKQCHARDNELQYSSVLKEAGNQEHVFFVIKRGNDIWRKCNGAVGLYDTKHGTNRYGFKLGCFVTVN